MSPPAASIPDQQPQPRRNIHLFSHPRTASNLLCHLLANQPGWTQAQYHFATAYDVTRKCLDECRLADLDREQYHGLEKLMCDGLARFHDDCHRDSDEDRCLLVKNHVAHVWQRPLLWQNIWGKENDNCPDHCEYLQDDPSTHGANPTVFSDDFSDSWLPIILIRHPALVFESWYRAETRVQPIDLSDKSWELYTTFRYSRQLYDWFSYRAATTAAGGSSTGKGDKKQSSSSSTGHSAFEPVVVDADDIVLDDTVVKKVCELCGMDPTLVRTEWGTLEPGKILSSRHVSYMAGFWSSTSVDRSKTAKGLSMEAKLDQWKNEFGLSVAAWLCDLVERALPDYHYLHGKRLR